MHCAREALKEAFLSKTLPCTHGLRGDYEEEELNTNEKADRYLKTNCSNHLLYLGKADLPHHPTRVRYLPYSKERLLLYNQDGHQEMTTSRAPEFYSLKRIKYNIGMADCVQTRDSRIYTITRSDRSAVLSRYSSERQLDMIETVAYPRGCLSSLVTDYNCGYLYGTNPALNCILRFSRNDLSLTGAQKFGSLWRPFDCCTSQVFRGGIQFLFVSNIDAGICAFNLKTMEIVAQCGDDLLPGSKYLAYDPSRCLLFASCCSERLLRCYKFEPYIMYESNPNASSAPPAVCASAIDDPDEAQPPRLNKIGDFLVANRKPSQRFSGPQGIMWDVEEDQLTVVSWSYIKGRFSNKVFRVNI